MLSDRFQALAPLAFALVSSVPSPCAPASVAWESDVTAALARAREQKRVVFVAVNMDGERACDRMAEKTYRDPEVIALASATIALIASPSAHATADHPCARFGVAPCAAHQETDVWVRKNVLKPDAQGFVVAPQHVFLDSEGKVLLSVPYEISASELEWCFVTALHAVDPQSKATAPSSARAPRRLILGGVWTPASDASSAPATRDEVLALVKEIKKGTKSDSKQDSLRRILSSDEPEGIDYVRSELRTSSDRAELLHSIGELSPPSYWELVSEFAIGAENKLRLEAAVALEQLAAPASLKVVQAALAHEDHREIRKEWIRALGAAGANDAGARKDLLKRVRAEKDELLRLNALVALGSLAPGTDVSQVLESVLASGTPAERAAVACALAITRDPRWLPVLDAAARGTSDAFVKDACTAAALSLRSGGLDAIRATLKQVAHDEVERDRWFGTRL